MKAGAVVALSILLLPARAQNEPKYHRLGSVEVAENTPGAIIFNWRGGHYVIDVRDAPLTDYDCAGCGANYTPTWGRVLGMNDATGTLYIEIPGLGWQNRPYVVFGYNIPKNQFTKITVLDPNEGTGLPALSHNAKYLALTSLARSGYMGACSYNFVQVIDLQGKSHAAVYPWGPLSPKGVGY